MPHSQFFASAHLFLYITILSILVTFVNPKPPNGFSLELIHRDSPQSPFYIGNHTNPQRLRFELVHDSRPIYVVKLHFGNPAIPLYLLPDTGSHLVWTQCEPCTHRFHQTSPIYNSAASHTYLKLPCEHPFCRNNNSSFKCQHGECVYQVKYMDGSMTEGVAASEIFQSSDNTQAQIYFGCSRNNRKFTSFEHNGKIGGVMGLSLHPVSIVQQLANITQHRFSYCLTPFITEGYSSSFLRFGADIVTRGRTFKSTPIISPPNLYHYYANLQDISVEGRRLNILPSVFAIKRDGSGGCFIDSGTSLTYLIQPAYRQVIAAFRAYYDSHGLVRVHAPETGLELCYKRSERLSKYASMTYHFEGADFEVKAEYIYSIVAERDAFCVELQSGRHGTILGAYQQIDTRFIFDTNARQILFSHEDCHHDR